MLEVSVNISANQIRDALLSNGREKALQIILSMDLAIADAGFTETLIKNLAGSLRADLNEKEWSELIADLSETGV